jgi:hypothetical protein
MGARHLFGAIFETPVESILPFVTYGVAAGLVTSFVLWCLWDEVYELTELGEAVFAAGSVIMSIAGIFGTPIPLALLAYVYFGVFVAVPVYLCLMFFLFDWWNFNYGNGNTVIDFDLGGIFSGGSSCASSHTYSHTSTHQGYSSHSSYTPPSYAAPPVYTPPSCAATPVYTPPVHTPPYTPPSSLESAYERQRRIQLGAGARYAIRPSLTTTTTTHKYAQTQVQQRKQTS